MSGTVTLWLLGGTIVVVWIALAQMRTRVVRARPSPARLTLRWVLLAYGIVLVALAVRSLASPPGPLVWLLLAALAAAAVGLGVARGAATHIWVDARGQALRRGGGVVLALWAVSLAAHLTVDALIDQRDPGVGPTTMLAYLVATVAAQNITVRRRVAALSPPPPSEVGH